MGEGVTRPPFVLLSIPITEAFDGGKVGDASFFFSRPSRHFFEIDFTIVGECGKDLLKLLSRTSFLLCETFEPKKFVCALSGFPSRNPRRFQGYAFEGMQTQ